MCEKEGVDVLLPLRTDDQLPLCTRLKDFETIGTVPALVAPSEELMATAVNKLRMLEYLQEVAGLPIPAYAVASTREELEAGLGELGYLDARVVIRPAHATGSRGFRILDPTTDRRKLFFEEKPTAAYATKEGLLEVLG